MSQPEVRPLLHFPDWRLNAHWWVIVPVVSAMQFILVAAALAKGFSTPPRVALLISSRGLAAFLGVQLLRYALAYALLRQGERDAAQLFWRWMDPIAWFGYVWGGASLWRVEQEVQLSTAFLRLLVVVTCLVLLSAGILVLVFSVAHSGG